MSNFFSFLVVVSAKFDENSIDVFNNNHEEFVDAVEDSGGEEDFFNTNYVEQSIFTAMSFSKSMNDIYDENIAQVGKRPQSLVLDSDKTFFSVSNSPQKLRSLWIARKQQNVFVKFTVEMKELTSFIFIIKFSQPEVFVVMFWFSEERKVRKFLKLF